jgi:ankyrin repeat protein
LTADVNSSCKNLKTPLNFILSKQNLSISIQKKLVKTLLKYNADPNIQDVKGKSPLHTAVNNPNIPHIIVELLLKNKGFYIFILFFYKNYYFFFKKFD